MLILPTRIYAKNNTNIISSNHITDLKNNKTICFDTIKKSPSSFILYMNFHDEPILNLNVQQGWRTMGEIAFGLADFQGRRKNYGLNSLESFEIGSQFNFNPNHFIIGPELNYNVSWILITFGASIIYLTDFSKGTLYLNPHLGFTYNTYIDLFIGYNIPLMKNNMKSLVNNFTATLAFPLIKRKFKL
jgi:hypothetical protein